MQKNGAEALSLSSQLLKCVWRRVAGGKEASWFWPPGTYPTVFRFLGPEIAPPAEDDPLKQNVSIWKSAPPLNTTHHPAHSLRLSHSKPPSRSQPHAPKYPERREEASDKMAAMVALRNTLRKTAPAVPRRIGMHHQQFVRTASLATVSSLGIDKATGITKPVSAGTCGGRSGLWPQRSAAAVSNRCGANNRRCTACQVEVCLFWRVPPRASAR